MQYVIYIGAALVIGLLVGFISLAIIWLKKAVEHNVRNHTLNLLSVYDDILEEKSSELSEIEAEKARILEEEKAAALEKEKEAAIPENPKAGISPSTILAAADRAAGTSYRDGSIGETYYRIRNNFSFNVEELVPAVSAESAKTKGPAGRLLDELSYETVYSLSTVSEAQQLQILSESLSGEGIDLLSDYLKEHKKFGIFDFYGYLKGKEAEEPQISRIYVPKGTSYRKENFPGNTEISADENICEGFQVEMGGKLYDYCIRTKELS